MNCMKMFFLALLFFAPLLSAQQSTQPTIKQRSFVFVIPSYNNKDWYMRNLSSVFKQRYKNYRIIYVDDASPDCTGKLVEAYIKKHKQRHRTTLIKNKSREFMTANRYKAIQLCKDHEVVVILDGDDWLAHNNVLNILNAAYDDPEVWMTYSLYKTYGADWRCVCKPYPEEIIKNNNYRSYPFVALHLRSFYAWLAKKVTAADLMLNGKFVPANSDMALMFPLLEMAGRHTHFVPEVLCYYNRATTINVSKAMPGLQDSVEKVLRAQPKWLPLES
jgi:glycosyltransferase involved in cell wall biosynthesis